jgi:hypothetical protein
MMLLIMQFFQPPITASLFNLGILRALFSNALLLCPFLNIRDNGSHSYRTTKKNSVAHSPQANYTD